MADCYLQFHGISKLFPGVKALNQVSFEVNEGSVHAMIGENGAGKSTLLKILSGVYMPDGGELRLGGQHVVFHSSSDAFANGVAVIYQELNLVPNMTVAENIMLGHIPSQLGVVDRKGLLKAAEARITELGENIPLNAKVSSLPIAQRQIVEIAKALSRDAKVIAFDEPTSSLSQREVQNLFGIIRSLKAQGKVILYVSHRLEEIFEIADSATVLRDGQLVKSFDTLDGITTGDLVSAMVGRAIQDIYSYTPRPIGPAVLRVEGLFGRGLSAPASLEVGKGEIVGIFGLVGAGRSELLKLIYGAVHPKAGQVEVGGEPVRATGPIAAIDKGLVLCPEDRKSEGIIGIRSVAENINISARRKFSNMPFIINMPMERRHAQKQVDALSIKTPSLDQLIGNLSGGNQQKAILARWLSENPTVIMMDEPTRGIDVGAKSEIYSIIFRLAEHGAGVLLVSSELPEVLGICDRVIVMRSGRLVDSVERGQCDEKGILGLALPVAEEAAV